MQALISQKIKKHLKKQHIRNKQIAKETGYSESQISKMLSGVQPPCFELLLHLHVNYGVDLNNLIANTTSSKLTDLESQILNLNQKDIYRLFSTVFRRLGDDSKNIHDNF